MNFANLHSVYNIPVSFSVFESCLASSCIRRNLLRCFTWYIIFIGEYTYFETYLFYELQHLPRIISNSHNTFCENSRINLTDLNLTCNYLFKFYYHSRNCMNTRWLCQEFLTRETSSIRVRIPADESRSASLRGRDPVNLLELELCSRE
jgi:hypothetical protein